MNHSAGKVTRRQILGASAASLGLIGLPRVSRAQTAADYPSREITAICGFPPGSFNDVIVRVFTNKFQAHTGKTIIVQNRPGAFANIATEAVARAKPDGHTIYLSGSSAMAAAPHIFKKINFDPQTDFTYVTTLANISFVLLVDAKRPIHSVADLTAHMKAKGKGAYASASLTSHVASELYKNIAGFEADLVNYRTTVNSMNDLLGGQIDFTFASSSFGLEQQAAGRLRILAMTGSKRMASVPGIPTMIEQGVPGFDLDDFWVASVPAKTPPEIVAKLEQWFNEIVATEDVRDSLYRIGLDPLPGTSVIAKNMIAKQTEAWKNYIRIAKVEPI